MFMGKIHNQSQKQIALHTSLILTGNKRPYYRQETLLTLYNQKLKTNGPT